MSMGHSIYLFLFNNHLLNRIVMLDLYCHDFELLKLLYLQQLKWILTYLSMTFEEIQNQMY